MVLHIFNPSHDEALGFGSPYYVPTKAAMLLARERCTLPELWAKPGDAILLTDDRERPVAHATDAPFLYIYKCELTPKLIRQITRIEPWGWNAYLRHTLRRAGIPDTLLPTEILLYKWASPLPILSFLKLVRFLKLIEAVLALLVPSPLVKS